MLVRLNPKDVIGQLNLPDDHALFAPQVYQHRCLRA
jgi:hypothetical protein